MIMILHWSITNFLRTLLLYPTVHARRSMFLTCSFLTSWYLVNPINHFYITQSKNYVNYLLSVVVVIIAVIVLYIFIWLFPYCCYLHYQSNFSVYGVCKLFINTFLTY